jgi:hypothetical protein
VQDGGSKEITRHAQTDSPTKWQTSSVNSLDTVSRLEIRLGLVPGFKWPAATTDHQTFSVCLVASTSGEYYMVVPINGNKTRFLAYGLHGICGRPSLNSWCQFT